ncbi:hypothetical protein C8E03_101788 [Lachnotalea glycerini]|uniref:DUF2383 domain-containing protein n=1 Tax=Lachnotalea glycerini TaxID=1763509 RepID=A0A255ICT9_9FIRM|nr:hypothetical protein [Lachnotalea glycerini]OYO59704.1 hypothetical protein CG709_17935 [Lachnotalea glycerini]PXV96153.1 hypothetical protein C8E03_101788 [Lachnotalea glycerini]RDY31271.1 hypothetical protein CG710_010270 [Lachnotalea glycerini]
MNEDTICLLKECNAGCKSATDSMEQVMQYVDNDKLKRLIDKYNEPHIHIGDECHELLNKYNKDEKDPSMLAKTFSWMSTEVKLMINDNTQKIAKIMMDGCNMGIQSLSEYINKYTEASKESISLAKKLVKTEQDFMDELKVFL